MECYGPKKRPRLTVVPASKSSANWPLGNRVEGPQHTVDCSVGPYNPHVHLLPTQQRDLFGVIAANGFKESDFKLDQRRPLPRLVYEGNELTAFMQINLRGEVEIQPGETKLSQKMGLSSWRQVLDICARWLGYLRRELDALDARAAAGSPPEWVLPELPSRYHEANRAIRDLKQEVRSLGAMSVLLWQSGDRLAEGVAEAFRRFGLSVTPTPPGATYDLVVNLEGPRRLLVEVTGIDGAIQKKSNKIGQVLQAVQEAGPDDRVVLALNAFRDLPPQDRVGKEIVTKDALALIKSLGVVIVPTAAIFSLWRSSLDRPEAGGEWVQRLYAAPPGLL